MSNKRPLENPTERDDKAFKVPALPSKVLSKSATAAPPVDTNEFDDLDLADIDDSVLELIDSAPDIEPLNETTFKKQLVAFEKQLSKNTELRFQFAHDPKKFMDSELALHEEIKKMEIVATSPSLYKLLVKFNTTESLITLLAHENNDIANDVVHLVNELTDPDVVVDARAETMPFVDGLVQGGLITVLIGHLRRLNEDEGAEEELQGVFESMSIVENLLELNGQICDKFLKDTKLFDWLLKRVQRKDSEGSLLRNRLYASELLSIVLQLAETQVAEVVKYECVEGVLTGLSHFRREFANESADEIEVGANLFNALCSMLLRGGAPAQARLRRADGVTLLLKLARKVDDKKKSGESKRKAKRRPATRHAATRALEYALSRSRINCVSFIESMGLGTLFKMMKHDDENNEERCISILSILLRALSDDIPNAIDDYDEDVEIPESERPSQQLVESSLARVLLKLKETDKMKRILDLRQRVYNAVGAAEKSIAIAVRVKELNGEEITEEQLDDYYSQRLDAGLATLQQCDLALALACRQSLTLRQQVVDALKERNIDMIILREIVQQYADTLADDAMDDSEETLAGINAVRQLADVFTKEYVLPVDSDAVAKEDSDAVAKDDSGAKEPESETVKSADNVAMVEDVPEDEN